MTKSKKFELFIATIIGIIVAATLFGNLQSLYYQKEYFAKYNLPLDISIGCYECNNQFDEGETCKDCGSKDIQLYAYSWCENCRVFRGNHDVYCSLCGKILNTSIYLDDTDIDLKELHQRRSLGYINMILALLSFLVCAVWAFVYIMELIMAIRNAITKRDERKE